MSTNRIPQRGGLSCEGSERADVRGYLATEETGADRPAAPISLATRAEFDAAVEARAAELESQGIRTLRLLLKQAPKGFDGFPAHLKEELYLRTGLRPVVMFERHEPYLGEVCFGKKVSP